MESKTKPLFVTNTRVERDGIAPCARAQASDQRRPEPGYELEAD